MKQPTLSRPQLKLIDNLVQHYVDNQPSFKMILRQLTDQVLTSKNLQMLVHSVKSRAKDPGQLRKKLIRKGEAAMEKGVAFPYTQENLFQKVNDLAGFRILHRHTKQIENINSELLAIFAEEQWVIHEGPCARTWDNESRDYFNKIGIKTIDSVTMYTSVHYVVQPNRKTALTCEIQVRTLMEEVWGEVDHQINYPVESESMPCKEQLKVLARVTSSCSRLVDSIFLAHQESTYNTTPKKITRKHLAKSRTKK